MKTRICLLLATAAFLSGPLLPRPLRAEETAAASPSEQLAAAVQKLIAIVEPPPGSEPKTFSTRIEIRQADGLPKELMGRTATLAFQAPDRAVLTADYKGKSYAIGRNGQEVWIHAPKFGVVGKPGLPRFATAPEKKDKTTLGPIKVPLPKEQLALLPLLVKTELLPAEKIDDARCRGLKLTPKPEAVEALKIPNGTATLWLRESDGLPVRIGYADGKGVQVELHLKEVSLSEPWKDERWDIPTEEGDKVESTALGHITRCVSVMLGSLGEKIPTLGPATGERKLMATEGKGRYERIDGTRVLYLEGSPEEMGHQHGVLLKKEIHQVLNRILYGVGVGSSFAKQRWFFGEIEDAQRRIQPFIDPRYLEEMDAIAMATGHDKEEIRLANFFPELFHCSGFALFGSATEGGKIYHGRILDYLRGMGLEQNAVVIVSKPDKGNAWVNISYAGFIGSVTGMNEKHVSIGEMGGRGEGNWDGKPMAQLVREVMEKADTLEQAVEIMRKGPRTCEYYYVITDAKSKTAVGIAATPTTFEVVQPGQAHPRLPHPVQDAVLMSAGDRYEELARRVKAGHGKFTADTARELMTRPVCMNSNIHSVLFDPETLDFWVANADSKNPASHTRYTRYNLTELLKSNSAVATVK
jgi:outer membrane lipoprotein-sorting protein